MEMAWQGLFVESYGIISRKTDLLVQPCKEGYAADNSLYIVFVTHAHFQHFCDTVELQNVTLRFICVYIICILRHFLVSVAGLF